MRTGGLPLGRRLAGLLLVCAALAAIAAGCGGDDETPTVDQPESERPASEPGTDNQPDTTTTAPPTTTETTKPGSGGTAPPGETTTTTPGSGGSAPPGSYDPGQPDSPENDIPPEPGTPEERFEKYCEEHPEACG